LGHKERCRATFVFGCRSFFGPWWLTLTTHCVQRAARLHVGVALAVTVTMAPLGEVDKYNIASIALYFVTFVASLLMTIWLLCFIRRRSDPARHWVSWLNGCFAVFTL
jgi:hypothetical protein